jgi:hypothetical protein
MAKRLAVAVTTTVSTHPAAERHSGAMPPGTAFGAEQQRRRIVRSVGDLDGNGRADLAICTRSQIAIHATQPPSLRTIPVGDFAMETADLDGDGRRELLLCRPAIAPPPAARSGRDL